MKTRSCFLSLSLFALTATAVYSQELSIDSVYRLLLKVAAAPSQVTYHGTVQTVSVGSSGRRVVVVQIEHQATGSDRVTILEPAEDAGRVFVRNSRRETSRISGGPLSLGLTNEKSQIRKDLILLLSNYSLNATDGGTVAGRDTYRIEILPKYSGRKSKEIWVDRGTGIILKSVVKHPGEKLVVTTQFTNVHLSPNSWMLPSSSNQPLLLPKQEAGRVSTGMKWIGVVDKSELARLNTLEKQEHFMLLSPGYLPPGFVLEQVREFPSPTDSHLRVVHILYSDGLSSISLFLQQEQPFWPNRVRSFFFGGRGHHDGNHHHPDERGVAVVEGSQDGTRYVLVSDVATQTLKQMAESLSAIQGVSD